MNCQANNFNDNPKSKRIFEMCINTHSINLCQDCACQLGEMLSFKDYYMIVEEGGLRFVHEDSAPSKKLLYKWYVQKHPEASILDIRPVKGHHTCRYCGNIVLGVDTNVLCLKCQKEFGVRCFESINKENFL